MAMVSDFFVERLKAWGVTRIYGYSGDGINGVLGALQRDGGIDFIQVRHEEMAAFMAVAHAKFTGEIGVCLATGGPGATHLLTGLYDAKLDHVPVLAISGQPRRLRVAAECAIGVVRLMGCILRDLTTERSHRRFPCKTATGRRPSVLIFSWREVHQHHDPQVAAIRP